jgi:CheY-like chemotaxis protein
MPVSRRLRIMVVDDQEAVCEVVSDTIRFAGHEVVGTARDGVEAVERAEQLRPEVVIMDVSMPRKNGVEAMRSILEAGTAQHVALMSGEYRSLGLTREEMMRNGAAAFLEKPFNVSQLFDLLRQWSE